MLGGGGGNYTLHIISKLLILVHPGTLEYITDVQYLYNIPLLSFF